MKILFVGVGVVLVGCACITVQPPPPAPVHAESECEAAQAQLDKTCPALSSTKKGTRFVVVCNDAAAAGDPTIKAQATCVSKAADCAAAKACS